MGAEPYTIHANVSTATTSISKDTPSASNGARPFSAANLPCFGRASCSAGTQITVTRVERVEGVPFCEGGHGERPPLFLRGAPITLQGDSS